MSENIESPNLTNEERKILTTLASKGLTSTKPGRSNGAIIYEGLEGLAKDYPGRSISKIMQSLVTKGYMRESNYDYLLLCPSCDYVNIYTNYGCPSCQSRKVRKTKLAEHKLCGYLGDVEEFVQADDYVCPKCKTHLEKITPDQPKKTGPKGESLRIIGSSFVCDKCGAKFDKPNIIHTCEHCGSDFTYKEANYVRLPIYEVAKKVDFTEQLQPEAELPDEIEVSVESAKPQDTLEHVPLLQLASEAIKGVESALKERGYTFQNNFKIRGKSGTEQSFTAAAQKGSSRILIDVTRTGNPVDIISLVGKKRDVDAESIILLDISGNPNIASLGSKYNIPVIDGRSQEYSKSLDRIINEKGDKE
jgi:hypothetical protein